MNSRRSRVWDDVPDDPDPQRDLGFEAVDLAVVRKSDGEQSHVLLLPPEDDDVLREEAFIVAEADAVVDLATQI